MLAVGGSCSSAFGDGGRICARESFGDCELTVFASPNPPRAGPVDVSVLLQNSQTGTVAADANVTVELTSSNPKVPPIRAAATSATATNKLFRSALVTLPEAGRWDVRVLCTLPETAAQAVHFSLDVAPPLPPWLAVWPWFAWPVVAIVLFVIHRLLVARRQLAGGAANPKGECGTVGGLPVVELAPLVR